MTIEPTCCSCKKNIKNGNILYMCVDNSFCSMHCRDRHLRYIKNFDPDFNYPERWNNNYSAKVDCLIEVDYLHFPRQTSSHKLYRSQSLTNLLEYKKNERVFITCVKLYTFNFRITNTRIKIIGLCIIIAVMSIIVHSLLNLNVTN